MDGGGGYGRGSGVRSGGQNICTVGGDQMDRMAWEGTGRRLAQGTSGWKAVST